MMSFSKLPCALIAGATLFGGSHAGAQTVFGDLVAQGSFCVGLDCPASPSFGFDTIILRENNLRIFFDDTSVSPFPNNKWRLTVNSSGSGGVSFFALDDVTGSKQPFRINAGARTNSVFVDSVGDVGFGTATPGLATHTRNGNTPGHRLEQDSSGGFTAQTWDVAGNEANFFIRDVTSGSRLPFRIRPGAPTSSIDIAASGNIGMGIVGPKGNLDVSTTTDNGNSTMFLSGGTGSGNNVGQISFHSNSGNQSIAHIKVVREGGNANGALTIATAPGAALQERMRVSSQGNVGIGTSAPTAQLHTTGSVTFAGITGCSGGLQTGGSGQVSCLVSSRQFKNIAGELPPTVALANVMALRPQTGAYKATPDVPEHWLIAEEVAEVDPALAGLQEGKPYVVKTQNVVADLVAVVQQQQRRIDELERKLAAR
jgi:hypothetical protein